MESERVVSSSIFQFRSMYNRVNRCFFSLAFLFYWFLFQLSFFELVFFTYFYFHFICSMTLHSGRLVRSLVVVIFSFDNVFLQSSSVTTKMSRSFNGKWRQKCTPNTFTTSTIKNNIHHQINWFLFESMAMKALQNER